MSIVLTPEGTPASPVEGEVYYDSTADKLKVRDSSAFREIVSKNSSGEIDGTFSGTIGGSADFPAGSLIDYDLTNITSTISLSASNNTPHVSTSSIISITLPANSTAIITAHGGRIFLSNSTTRRNSIAIISYTTDGNDPSASSNLIYGGEASYVSPTGTGFSSGIVEGKVTNSSGSDVTLKWTWGVVGTSTLDGQWQTEASGRGNISLKTLIFKD